MDITIDPEFHALIPPLQPDEYRGLEQSLIKEGCRDALVIWNDILLDGHNRHEICTRLNIPYNIIEITLSDRDTAMDWIDANQLGRRNLTPDQMKVIRSRLYNRQKKTWGGKREASGQNDHLKTAEVIAKASGEEDMKEATDLKIKITAGDVAVRIRRFPCPYRDLTIRAVCGGFRTEINKLQEGFGDWYLYAWENNSQNGIDEWILIDINKARPLFSDQRPIKMNPDGRTGFLSYSTSELYSYDSIVSLKLQSKFT